MNHENGITVSEAVEKTFSSKETHDPSDISRARDLVMDPTKTYLGLFYQDKDAPCYDEVGASNIGFTVDQKEEALNLELDRYAV